MKVIDRIYEEKFMKLLCINVKVTKKSSCKFPGNFIWSMLDAKIFPQRNFLPKKHVILFWNPQNSFPLKNLFP